MTLHLQKLVAVVLACCVLTPVVVDAQGPPPPGAIPAPATQPPPAPQLSQDQLDALLAPIALYPDQLLSQVLMASTYPLDVVEAARFVQQNPGLKGPALDQALQGKNWDPSVQSLAAFPQVLAMMSDKLEWTQQLGDAFLANQQQVMQTVQSLRARAQAAGNLQSTEQQKVIVQQKTIIIEPAQPSVVYVPVYNPTVIYGPWWVPAYRPWFWYPPPIYGYPPLGVGIGVGFVWGTAWAVSANHWGWCHPNWGGNNININVNNTNNVFINNRTHYTNNVVNGNWQHNTVQRRGVAYRDTTVQNRYRPANTGAQTREAYRGRESIGSAAGQAGGAGMQRPTTGQLGGGGTPRPTTEQLGGAGGQRPATGQVGGAGAQRPTTLERQAPVGSGMTGDRTGGAATRPTQTPSVGQARPSPTFNAEQSRPQAQQYSNRGAQSRAAMSAAPQAGATPGAASRSGAQGGGHGGRGGEGGGGRGEGGGRGRG
ncbi:MAG TPA: DUF3300 domain-containing protein [Casimicrobiaceae bacterium]|nr:DUF3300 domain-containing protein [Casimicrobiaceae bacterium]